MKILTRVLDLFFPPICGFCGKLNTKYICNECEKIVNLEAINKINSYNKNYNRHLYIFKYEGIIREKIIDYKFNNKVYLYRTFTEAVLKNKENIKFIEQYDFLIPVPIHKERKKVRGYNQSELIARYLCDEIKEIKLQLDVLKKNKDIIPQSSLNKDKRSKNIQGAYSVIRKKKIQGKKVLLLDDVYTTGSTVNECSKVLIEGGCSKVGIITIAKD